MRTGIEIYIPFNATVFPVVLPFKIGAIAVTEYFHGKFITAFFQQLRNVEVRRQTAVFGISGKLTVHPYIISGFHSFEVKEDIHTFPTIRDGKLTNVGSYRIVIGRHIRRIGRKWIAGICIDRSIESLQFPTSGNLYFAPLPGIVSGFMEILRAKIVIL